MSTKAPSGQPTVTATYDLANRLKQLSKPVVANDPSSGALQFFYDTSGRFFKEQTADSKITVHVLDANGNRTRTTFPDGYFYSRSFDQLNRLSNIKLNGSATNAVVFSYNQLSQRTQLTYSNGATALYTPQLNEDLTGITHNFVGSSVAFTYGYNLVHEPLTQSVSDSTYMWHPTPAGTVTYGTADNVNKYPTVGGTSYSYNGNKCLTGDGVWTYGFDTENHLLTASKTGTSASFVYDPLHRQSQKTVGSTKTRYIYSGWQRIADYNGATGALQNRYVYGVGMDEPLIRVTSTGVLTFLHHDKMGSIVGVSNASGAIANKNKFSPFGEITSLGGTTFGFTGQRYDSELGLLYFKRRYMSAKLGRFLQPDPVGYTGQDFNLYTYVGNSPLLYTDPMGLQRCWSEGTGDGKANGHESKPGTKPKEKSDWQKYLDQFSETAQIKAKQAYEALERMLNGPAKTLNDITAIMEKWRTKYPGHNDLSDAMRHAETSKEIAEKYGKAVADALGTLNEVKGNLNSQPQNEADMDYHNNAVGRDAAGKGPIDQSRLITQPGGSPISK